MVDDAPGGLADSQGDEEGGVRPGATPVRPLVVEADNAHAKQVAHLQRLLSHSGSRAVAAADYSRSREGVRWVRTRLNTPNPAPICPRANTSLCPRVPARDSRLPTRKPSSRICRSSREGL